MKERGGRTAFPPRAFVARETCSSVARPPWHKTPGRGRAPASLGTPLSSLQSLRGLCLHLDSQNTLSVREQGRGEHKRAVWRFFWFFGFGGGGGVVCFFPPLAGHPDSAHTNPKSLLSQDQDLRDEPLSPGEGKSFPPRRKLAHKPPGTCEDVRPRARKMTSVGSSWGLPKAGGHSHVTRGKKTQAQRL